MTSSSSRQNSRFSSLKVFKFGGGPQKPPPPPPKDPYYLANHSLASLHQTLSPELSPLYTAGAATPSYTMPTPAGYASSARSPSPTSSYQIPNYAPSYAASRCTLGPSTASLVSPDPSEPSSSRKGFFKFGSLGKRPKTPKSASSVSSAHPTDLPSEPTEDPSISRPWNFQVSQLSFILAFFANYVCVHSTTFTLMKRTYCASLQILCSWCADLPYRFSGLPPTWSASLAEMGFSEDEIANIYARRAASRPTLYALKQDRPDSPASSTYSSRSRSGFPMQPPSRRDVDAMSRHSESSYAADISRNMSMSAETENTSYSEDASSVFATPTRLTQSPETTYASPSQFPQPPDTIPVSQLATPSKDTRPRTPIKRSYHVVNDSIITISPPPAYASPKKDSSLDACYEDMSSLSKYSDANTLAGEDASGEVMEVMNSEGTEDVTAEDEDEDEEISSLPSVPIRSSNLPPRLSLHQDAFSDLSNWTESLFSIIPSTPPKTPETGIKHAVAPSSPGQASVSTVSSPPRASTSSRFSAGSKARQLPPQKPLPSLATSGHAVPPSPAPPPPPPPTAVSDNSDLWEEVYDMIRSPSPGADSLPTSSFLEPTPKTTSDPDDSSRPASSDLKVEFTRDNRDSNMSTMTVTPATIVRHVSVVKRARANVIRSPVETTKQAPFVNSFIPSTDGDEIDDKRSARSNRSTSPDSSDSNCSDGSSASASATSSSDPVSSVSSRPTTLTVGEVQNWKGANIKTNSIPYVETSPQPSPLAGEFNHTSLITQATVRGFRESEEEAGIMQRPSIVIDNIPAPRRDSDSPWSVASMAPSPITPALRYAGWVAELVSPIKEFIDDTVDPRDLYGDLTEIAEGESGSVYAARALRPNAGAQYVAIKQVALIPSGTPKLADLERELQVMNDLRHGNVLSMQMLYIDLVEDSLWISMELMDRSLADILNLLEEGIEVQEEHIAHFAKDVSNPSSTCAVH
jgi:hypothetical protein